MSALLSQALGQLNLQPGQTYRTTVNGREFEVRALEQPRQEESGVASQFETMTMLEPWFEMPEPIAAYTVPALPGVLPLPDAPVIPAEQEAEP